MSKIKEKVPEVKKEAEIVPNNEKKPNKKMVVIVAILLIAVVAVFSFILIKNAITANAIREQKQMEFYQDWLVENCECLARERYYCLGDGFEIMGDYCFNAETNHASSRILGCSLYSCAEGNVTWNAEIKKWEPKIA